MRPKAELAIDSEAMMGEKNNCFSKIQLVGQKYREKTKDLKNSLKQWIYTCRSLWNAGRRDCTLFGVVGDTTPTKFTGRACAVHGISLPVVVDKVVVVVLKFPIVDCRTCRMMSQVYNMKGPGHKDRLIRHFVFIAVHIAIVPATSARCIQSIICIGETLRN